LFVRARNRVLRFVVLAQKTLLRLCRRFVYANAKWAQTRWVADRKPPVRRGKMERNAPSSRLFDSKRAIAQA